MPVSSPMPAFMDVGAKRQGHQAKQTLVSKLLLYNGLSSDIRDKTGNTEIKKTT